MPIFIALPIITFTKKCLAFLLGAIFRDKNSCLIIPSHIGVEILIYYFTCKVYIYKV